MFRITARTVLELGSELISSDIIAFYELIKNGFDARTKNGVTIAFDIVLSRHALGRHLEKIARGGDLELHKAELRAALDPKSSQALRDAFTKAIEAATSHQDLSSAAQSALASLNRIIVSDTGKGMSLEDLTGSFLVIGTPSRKLEVEAALAAGAKETPYLGEKGIGRLSAMRLGEKLRVVTAQQIDKSLNLLEIDWRAFGDVNAMLDQIPVSPSRGGAKPAPDWSGTSIIISDLTENWTETRVRQMAEYDFARLTDPFDDAASRPRVAITFNGERLPIPFMPRALLEAAHASVSGKYEIVEGRPTLTCTLEALDLGFEHPREKEIITLTLEDLQGAIIGKDGDMEDSALVTVGPFSFEAHWYNRRRLSKIEGIGEQRAVRELQEKWSGCWFSRGTEPVFPPKSEPPLSMVF